MSNYCKECYLRQERIEALRAERDRYKQALEDLLYLKHYKEENGKDQYYIEAKPKAWEYAASALEDK